MNKMNKKGFTLIEMLVVIAIIAVLVSIIVPTVANATNKAKGATDAANLRTITAEAAIDLLDDNKVESGYKLASKWTNSELDVTFYRKGEDLVAVVTADEQTVSVEYFAFIAEHGDTTSDKKGADGKALTAPTVKTADLTAVTVNTTTP